MIQKSFAWIKRNLDPSMSYIIFENDLSKQFGSLFSESLMAYHYLKKQGLSLKKVLDTDHSKEYLVIKIEPGSEDEIFGKLMGYEFPKSTVSYLYKAEKGLS